MMVQNCKQLSKGHACWVGVARWWMLKYSLHGWDWAWPVANCTQNTCWTDSYSTKLSSEEGSLKDRYISSVTRICLFVGFCRENVIRSLREFLYPPVGWRLFDGLAKSQISCYDKQIHGFGDWILAISGSRCVSVQLLMYLRDLLSHWS